MLLHVTVTANVFLLTCRHSYTAGRAGVWRFYLWEALCDSWPVATWARIDP